MADRIFPELAKPAVLGHRGFSSIAPENTMSAFEACRRESIPGIELDVHRCASGEVVVIHDHQLKRTTGAEGTVEESSFAKLRSLDAGSFFSPEFAGERIPLLQEVFETFGSSMYFDVELKYQGRDDIGLGKRVSELISSYGLASQVLVSSFNPFQIRHFEKHARGAVPTAVIFAVDPEVPKRLQRGQGRLFTHASVLKPKYSQVTEAWFARYHDRKSYGVFTWTVDDPEEIRRLARLGVEGIISNDPKQTMEVLATAY